MKLLLVHLKKIQLLDIKKSNRPTGIFPNSKSKQFIKENSILGTFICVEKKDVNKDEIAKKAFVIIQNHLNMLKRKKILLIPFAHLSRYLASPKEAIRIIDNIEKEFLARNYYIKKASFGYHKNINLSLSDLVIHGHPGSVAFRDI